MLGLRFRIGDFRRQPVSEELGGVVRFEDLCAKPPRQKKENKRHTARATKSDVPRTRTVKMAVVMATCLPADNKKYGRR